MRKLSKKISALLFTVTLAASSLGIYNINAAEQTKTTDNLKLYSEGAIVPLTKDYNFSQNDTSDLTRIFSSGSTVEETLYEGLSNSEKDIDISSYDISKSQLKQLMQDIINNNPDLFYVASQYSYYTNNDKITSVVPSYEYSGSDLEKKMTVYKNGMNDILSGINSSWSDLEKIVYVHDYLCQQYEYDTTYSNYDAYSFFSTGKGVCQAYTAVFSGIMKALDIEVSTASSDSMKHIWNVVKLNGKWYHVDVTWDDPVSDKFSLASHLHILHSDSSFKTSLDGSQAHSNWVSNYTCTDKTYDNYFWTKENITSPFKYLNGKWYCASFNSSDNKTGIYAGDLKSKGTLIHTLDLWYLHNSTNSYMTRAYCGMDIYNNTLYFNSYNKIFSYTPQTGVKEFLSPSVNGRLCGLRVDEQSLKYSYTTDYNASGSKQTHNLGAATATATPAYTVDKTPAPSTTSTPVGTVTNPPVQTPGSSTTVLKGDFNSDGKVSLSEVTIVLKAALNIITLDEASISLGDINNDGSLNLSDASLSLKLALGIPI